MRLTGAAVLAVLLAFAAACDDGDGSACDCGWADATACTAPAATHRACCGCCCGADAGCTIVTGWANVSSTAAAEPLDAAMMGMLAGVGQAASVAVLITGAAPGLPGRLAMVRAHAGTCEWATEEEKDGMDLARELHPTGFALGSGRDRELVGAAVMNLLLCAASLLALKALAVLQAFRTGRTVRHCEGWCHWPGAVFVPYSILLPGTVLAAGHLLMEPSSAGSAAVGGIALGGCLALPWWLWKGVGRAGDDAAMQDDPRLSRRGAPEECDETVVQPYRGTTRAVYRLLMGPRVWVNHPRQRQRMVCERFGYVFFAVNKESLRMAYLDVLTSLLTGLICAWHPAAEGLCTFRKVCLAGTLGCQFLVCCFVRPYAAAVDNALAGTYGFAVATAASFLAFGWAKEFRRSAGELLFGTAVLVLIHAALRGISIAWASCNARTDNAQRHAANIENDLNDMTVVGFDIPPGFALPEVPTLTHAETDPSSTPDERIEHSETLSVDPKLLTSLSLTVATPPFGARRSPSQTLSMTSGSMSLHNPPPRRPRSNVVYERPVLQKCISVADDDDVASVESPSRRMRLNIEIPTEEGDAASLALSATSASTRRTPLRSSCSAVPSQLSRSARANALRLQAKMNLSSKRVRSLTTAATATRLVVPRSLGTPLSSTTREPTPSAIGQKHSIGPLVKARAASSTRVTNINI
eukprot:TRINITY_DN12065_c0_g1_i2.p1 TRINITY_DN12065_c0_g1~~TRINITY_DN12065_c0_g1_i2.p1  ORF type:complete len:697 (+),score=84.25 TRINITY_DN12065_c0_g1_i2:42-2132(+)